MLTDRKAMGPKILLTGIPGCGKTTLAGEVARRMDPSRLRGFLTREIREGGVRKGFRVTLLHEKGESILAHVQFRKGPRVGRYGVQIQAFEAQVLPFLEGDPNSRFLYLLDEIGKMECLSGRFRASVDALLESPAAVLATVPMEASGFPGEVKSRKGVLTVQLRPGNRDEVRSKILSLFASFLREAP